MAKSTNAAQAPENVIASTFRAVATSLRAQADASDALAAMYDDASPAAGEATKPAATAKATTAAAAKVEQPKLDEVKNALMALVSHDGKDRTRVDAIFASIGENVKAAKDIPTDQYANVLAQAKAAIATPKPVAEDDI